MKHNIFLLLLLLPVIGYSNLISVSGGIAHPSFNSGLRENAAGFIYNQKAKIAAEALIPSGDGKNTYGAHYQWGDADYGASIGFRHRSEENSNSKKKNSTYEDDDDTDFGKNAGHLALAVKSDPISFGISTWSDLDETDFEMNAGILYDGLGVMVIGVTAYSLTGGPNGYGAGVDYKFSNSVSLVLDASANKDFEGYRLKPGFVVSTQSASLSLSYGFDLDDSKTWGGAMAEDLSIGGSLLVTDSFLVQAYFRQLSHIYINVNYMF
jgi:hypothetical protein